MNTSWFSHDSNARNSKKLIRLRQKYGAAGYGVYWMLVERLRDEEAYTSDKDYDMIAFDLRVDVELIRAVVEDFGLFDISEDGKTFHAPGLDERMELKDIRSAAGKKGALVKWGIETDKLTRSKRLTIARTKGTHTKEEWAEMKGFFNSCVKCGKSGDEIKLEKDHIVPIYLGGSDSITNLQPLCHYCNQTKCYDSHDYRIDWCEKHGVEMPERWMQQNNEEIMETPGKTPALKERIERKEKKSKNTSSSFSSSSPVGEGVEKAEKEKEEILFNFVFEKNMTAPNKEYEKFMRYNNSDGREWDSLSQSKKDRAIEEWQQKPEKPPRFGEDFLSMWKNLYESLIQHGAPIDVRLDALSDGIRCTVSDGYMKLHCSERFSRYIEEENMDGVRDILWPFVAKYAKKLRYINDVNPTRQAGE